MSTLTSGYGNGEQFKLKSYLSTIHQFKKFNTLPIFFFKKFSILLIPNGSGGRIGEKIREFLPKLNIWMLLEAFFKNKTSQIPQDLKKSFAGILSNFKSILVL